MVWSMSGPPTYPEVNDRPQPPTPGIPEGCSGYWRESQWFGTKKTKSVDVYRLTTWATPELKKRGKGSMTLLVRDGMIISTKRATKGVPAVILRWIQEGQAAGMTARDIRLAIEREFGGVVDLPAKDDAGKYVTEPYKTSQSRPPMWRHVWHATRHLAHLVYDKRAGGPGCLSRGDGIQTTLKLQLRGIGVPTYRARGKWFDSLSQRQREDLAWAIRARGNDIVANPPHWEWWTGKTGSRMFLKVNEYSCTVGVRPIISYKAGDSCLRTLILRWIGPRTDFVKQTGIERQRQLFQRTS